MVLCVHHLDIERAFESIKRVLTPGGRCVFLEPLHHNPLINYFRKITPSLRSIDEHPLNMKDLNKICSFFENVKLSFHVFTVLLALPLTFFPGHRVIIHVLNFYLPSSVFFYILSEKICLGGCHGTRFTSSRSRVELNARG